MNLDPSLYPIKFKPILKEKVWGGSKLSKVFHKQSDGIIGESWEISGVEGNVSVVQNGSLMGKTLFQLIDKYKEKLVGEMVYKNFGNTFPLLFKFIDAREDLSVQLHPDDKLAKERHNSFGKTEMWYILETEKTARLILGFNQEMDEEKYLYYLSENKLSEILHSEKVNKGDSFFITPGTVHAIGAGVMLAEIQQTSDITYRIYDWDRPGIDGNLRELHTDLALQAINFKKTKSKLIFSDKENSTIQICSTPYFNTNKIILTKDIERDHLNNDSFVVYMCLDGEAILKTEGFSLDIIKGDTILIPAVEKKVKFITNSATFLEVYIQ